MTIEIEETGEFEEAGARNSFAPMRQVFRNLLVHASHDAAGVARIDTAVRLARRLDARLTGVGAEMYDPALLSSGYGVGVELVADLERMVEASLTRSGEIFAEAAAGLETSWIAVRDRPANALAALAGQADLIIASRPLGLNGGAYRQCDAGELVVNSGCPVLLPPLAGGQLWADAVVVAWKNTRESRRAIRDALPLLRSAADVLVVAVCRPDAADDLNVEVNGVVQHLKRHSVNARAKVRVALEIDAAAELQVAATNMGADLIVAGGYGHSRLGEWMFGGVTRDLLNLPTGFVFLSH